jgi:hypothetical protein
MKFDDIHDPMCDRCKTPHIERWTAICDAKTGDVKEVICSMCKDNEALNDWSKDRRLYSSTTMTAALNCYEGRKPRPGESLDSRWFEIHSAYNRVQAHVKENFEPSVWFGHAGQPFTRTPDKEGFGHTAGRGKGRAMMPLVYKSNHSHLTSGKIVEGALTYVVNTWCTAGRALIEVESAKARITLITEDGSELLRMGIQGIDATEDEAIELLGRAETAWLAGAFDLTQGSTKLDGTP